MGKYLSPEQVLNKNIEIMGNRLGSIFTELENELIWLHHKWDQYLKLFGRSEKQIIILNETANGFFGLVQMVLFEDIILHISRLTDPSKTFGKKNLSLRSLSEYLTDLTLKNKVSELIDGSIGACPSVNKWRNNRIAHRDLHKTIARMKDPLPNISRLQIDSLLRSFDDVLNIIQDHFGGGETIFGDLISKDKDAESLFHYLNLGLEADKKRLARIKDGTFLPDDFKYDKI